MDRTLTGASQRPDRGLTLAACLANLAAGDPCPCCGAPLRVVGACGRSCGSPVASGGIGTGGPGLECGGCGCEVAPIDQIPVPGMRATYSAAA